MIKAYTTIESKKVFSGKILDIYQDTITLPNGEKTLREIAAKSSASAVIPIDKDGNIVFVRQYRHAIKEMVLEIPAGIFDEDELAPVCASRELEEEIGFKAGKLTFLAKMVACVGFCDEEVSIFLAENLTEGKQNLDEDEFVTIEKYSLEESIKKIFSGEIIDSKTMFAVLAYKEFLQNRSLL